MSTALTFTLNDGTSIPWFAFGTGTALYGQDSASFVSLAIRSGVTHIDGAQSYRNEESMGEGIKASGKPRSELYIVTKLRKLDEGQTVRQSLESSLSKLGVDHVDLFLIHNPTVHTRDGKSVLKQVWREMEEVKRAGLTTSIGVSNFSVAYLAEVCEGATILPAVNQIELHPYVLKAAQPILDYGRDHGILTASYGGQTPLFRVSGPVLPVLDRIRARLEETLGTTVTPGQILVKWLHQKGTVVVTTTSKESRLKEYLDAANLPHLTPEDMTAIDEAGATLHSRQFGRNIFNDS